MHALVRCQFEPLLRRLPAVVKACTQKQEKKTTFFELEFDETILFPEGGGQPTDQGRLFAEDTAAELAHITAVYHADDGRVAHRADKAVETGARVVMGTSPEGQNIIDACPELSAFASLPLWPATL